LILIFTLTSNGFWTTPLYASLQHSILPEIRLRLSLAASMARPY